MVKIQFKYVIKNNVQFLVNISLKDALVSGRKLGENNKL